MAKRKGKRGGKGKVTFKEIENFLKPFKTFLFIKYFQGAKKKHGAGHKPAHYLTKTKFEAKSLHLDQIHENFKDENVQKLVADPNLNDDLPGAGQNYCLHCE